jgi:hypothetical protein
MFNIPALLAKIPDEYKAMAVLGIGSLMLVGLALFHGAGLRRAHRTAAGCSTCATTLD